MNRKIEFRCWHKIQKRWINRWEELDPQISIDGTIFLYDRETGDWDNLEYVSGNLILQQFTGVVTLDEKQIYEGDIVHYTPPSCAMYGADVAEIIWDENGWFVKSKWWKWILGREFAAERLRIVGNIIENPELLK